jgi:hypothetical protein
MSKICFSKIEVQRFAQNKDPDFIKTFDDNNTSSVDCEYCLSAKILKELKKYYPDVALMRKTK